MKVRILRDTPPHPKVNYRAGQIVDLPGLTDRMLWYLNHGYAELVRDVPAPEAAQLPRAKPRVLAFVGKHDG